jgi:hypothetical protein
MNKGFIGILAFVFALMALFVFSVAPVAAYSPDAPLVSQEASVLIPQSAPAQAAEGMEASTILVIVMVTIFIAVLIESVVEFLIAPIFNNFPKLTKFKWMQMYIACAVGIGAAFLYQLDLISLLSKYLAQISAIDFQFPVTIIGLILTGAAIGRGSNYLHDLVMKWFTKSVLTNIPADSLKA